MTTRTRSAGALVRAMQTAGVRRLFTLSGNHIMSVFDAALDAGITLVHTRHEAAAVFMADAWGRLTGEPGVALVTGGPGHANAVGALYTAAMSESPVVLLSGHAPVSQLGTGAFQEMRQADIAAPLTKLAMTSARADDIARDFAAAMRTARSGRRGPVHLSLPSDCLDGDADMAQVPGADAFAADAMALDDSTADAMLARLAAAKRPLIVAGPMLMTRAGRVAATRLQDATGIAVVGMESPRGLADASLGGFAQMLAQADCVLLLGKRLDYTLKFGKPPAFMTTMKGILMTGLDDEQLRVPRPALRDTSCGERKGRAVRGDRYAPAPRAGEAAAAEPDGSTRCRRRSPRASGRLGQRALGVSPGRTTSARGAAAAAGHHRSPSRLGPRHGRRRVQQMGAGAAQRPRPRHQRRRGRNRARAAVRRRGAPGAAGRRRDHHHGRQHLRLSSGRDRHRGARTGAIRRDASATTRAGTQKSDPAARLRRQPRRRLRALAEPYDNVAIAFDGHSEHVTYP